MDKNNNLGKMHYTQKKETIEVLCRVPARRHVKDPFIKVDTEKVLDFLGKEGYNLEDYVIESGMCCDNTHKNNSHTETWIWRKQKTERKGPNVKRTQNSRTRKTTKKPETNKLLGVENME